MKQETLTGALPASVSRTPEAAPDENKPISHLDSMAVWDIPFQIVLNSRFNLKVGVQCSAACKLTGATVEIYDHNGALAGTGTLGQEPLATTNSLYWTEIELQAPGTEGPFGWSAKFSEPNQERVHAEITQQFTFATVKPPECIVSVEVVDKERQTPIHHAKVIMHPYSGFTDEQGRVDIGVTTGEYKLWIPRIASYDTFRKMVRVDTNIAVKAELVPAPVPEP